MLLTQTKQALYRDKDAWITWVSKIISRKKKFTISLLCGLFRDNGTNNSDEKELLGGGLVGYLQG